MKIVNFIFFIIGGIIGVISLVIFALLAVFSVVAAVFVVLLSIAIAIFGLLLALFLMATYSLGCVLIDRSRWSIKRLLTSKNSKITLNKK